MALILVGLRAPLNPSSSEFEPAPIPAPGISAQGKDYMMDARGDLKPVEAVKSQYRLQYRLEDELVRREFGYALALSSQIKRFKGHCYENLGQFDALLAQEYSAQKGGMRGNKTYSTFDGLMQVKIRVQDRIAFGPEIFAAKALFDECLNEWSEDTRAELRSFVANAFDTDKAGTINRSHVFILLNTESDDERWQNGQRAIKYAIRVIGSASYIQFQNRESTEDKFEPVTIDLAKA
ncbi:hypothetical protein RSK20926_21709 [Roseobacter sp. SK209-2-6]|uniref:DUF3164 family protein n=1 Tax=Roseobacter sp. SK209-2-6 TaxID=388739 RepID=UPI0000F3F3D0|nr:DUF3164 family protein [Roseobacter sp. SK209-2-6]EBA16385.1 hypothetical protein RSK20926_21709 [Roseobacter sp. SK209-2-6]